VLAGLAVYLVFTVLERMEEGRCRSNGADMECSFQKPQPIPPPKGPESVA
jgi:hypothetical protein